MSRTLLLATVVAAFACGGKAKTTTVEHSDSMAGMHEGDHPTMPPAIDAFHAKLAPLWHAEAGATRTADTCASVGSMDEMLVEAENAAAPDGVDGATWSERLGSLRTLWGELGADCVENHAADFDARFTDAHNAFHALIDLLPMADK